MQDNATHFHTINKKQKKTKQTFIQKLIYYIKENRNLDIENNPKKIDYLGTEN